MIVSQNKPVSTEQIDIDPKLDSNGIAADKLNDMFERTVSKPQNKYNLLDIRIDNPDKLKDTYNI